MAGIAEVLSFTRKVDEGAHVADVKADPGGEDPRTLPHFADAGDDSQPLPGDFVATAESAGAGSAHVTGYADTRNAGKAAAGEKRIYARNAAGVSLCEVWCKNDGTVVIANDAGTFEMAPDGSVTINGVVIAADGTITAPGAITASGVVTGSDLATATATFNAHYHLSAAPGSPTGAPMPGPPPP